MAVCSPEGNRGLPIILQGPVTPTILNSIKSSSFIELKPSARSTFPSYDDNWVFHESAQTTIRFEAANFTLQHIQLFKTVNRTYYDKDPIAEFSIWYKGHGNKVIVTFIPVFLGAAKNPGGEYLAAALTKDTLYKGSVSKLYGSKSIHYDTCVGLETPTGKIPVNVFVFLEGIIIDSPTHTLLHSAGRLKEFGFPAILLPSLDSKTIMIPGTTNTLDTSHSYLRKVYTTLVSTGSDNFTNRFRFYEKTFVQSELEQKKDSTAYKCVAIDASKDLKKVGDKYVVSLDNSETANAQSLQDIVNQQKLPDQQQADISDAATYIAAAIGTLTGAALASGALWACFRLLLRK
jgi:hypothetical protein